MKILIIILIFSYILHVEAFIGWIIGWFTTTTTPTTRRPGESHFQFEGVNYDILPENLMKLNNDCYAIMMDCVRHQPMIGPVCGYHTWKWTFEDFYSPCQIELTNCLSREEHGLPHDFHANDRDYVYYNGEGYDCDQYARRGGSMYEAYFGKSLRKYFYNKNRRRQKYELRGSIIRNNKYTFD